MRYVPTAILGLCAAGISLEMSFAADQPGVPKDRIASVLEATKPNAADPDAVRDAYRTLFESPDTDVSLLTSHSDSSLALAAAWQRVRLSAAESEAIAAHPRVDQRELYRFLGFLEGRLRVSAPDSWKRVLERASAMGGTDIGFTVPLDTYRESGIGHLQVDNHTVLELRDGEFKIIVKRDSAIVPLSALQLSGTHELAEKVATLLSEQEVLFALHGDTGAPYEIVCVDRSGHTKWRSTTWGNWWGDTTGLHSMCVTMVVVDDRLIVFGASTTGLHIEVLSMHDGRGITRFFTTR